MKTNVVTVAAGNTVLNALAKGVCPICSLARAFQNEMIEGLRPGAAATLCNYHAWAIAASSPAGSVIEIFLTMLRNTTKRGTRQDQIDCDLCSAVREHEIARLREFASEMQRAKFAEFVGNYGTLCRFHGSTLISFLPQEHAKIVNSMMENNQQELERMLQSYAATVQSGGRSGGGILGRTAEFLVAQRGLTR